MVVARVQLKWPILLEKQPLGSTYQFGRATLIEPAQFCQLKIKNRVIPAFNNSVIIQVFIDHLILHIFIGIYDT